jgi:hypothetical protein
MNATANNVLTDDKTRYYQLLLARADAQNALAAAETQLKAFAKDDVLLANTALLQAYRDDARNARQRLDEIDAELKTCHFSDDDHVDAVEIDSAKPHSLDSHQTDVLSYLASLGGDLSAAERLEHYQVLKLSLLKAQQEDAALFDLALKEVSKKLSIKAKTVKADLAALREPPTAEDARKLLNKMNSTRALRLAQDFVDNRQWFGVIAGEDKLLLNSDRELLTLEQISDGLTVKNNGFDDCRLSKEAILHFLSGGTATGYELLADLRTFFTRFAVFRDKRIALLLAAWTLGTYCYRVFRVFPYLALRSPEKRCGKSRVLDLLSLLAFNASAKTVNPTAPQLFRSPSRNGGALLLDEIEKLGGTDKEAYANLLSVLNSGFEKNGTVQRQDKDARGNFVAVNYETFAPYAIAGINKTAETLEDRSLFILMQRKLAREKTERFSPSRLEDEAQALRDRCYLWALTHAVDLAAVYEQADKFFPALDSLDDRARDLWEPLISIAAVADVERSDGQKTLTDELTALARDLCQVRDGAAEDSTTVHVISALLKIAEEKRLAGIFQTENVITLTPTELATSLKEKLSWEKLSTRYLATLLNPLGLYSKNTRFPDGKVNLAYHLSRDSLAELSERYTQNTAENEEKK